MKVLVLDDDPVSLKSIAMDISKLGYDVVEASNSLDALDFYGKESDNLKAIITDLEMPIPNGVEFIKDIRNIDPVIPIIIISGTIDAEVLKLVKKYNCADVLVKPHDKMRLKIVLESL